MKKSTNTCDVGPFEKKLIVHVDQNQVVIIDLPTLPSFQNMSICTNITFKDYGNENCPAGGQIYSATCYVRDDGYLRSLANITDNIHAQITLLNINVTIVFSSNETATVQGNFNNIVAYTTSCL